MDAAELAYSRAEIESEMIDTCEVFTPGQVEDAYGGVGGPPSASVSYKCRLQEQLYTSPREEIAGGAVESSETFIIKTPWDAVIGPKDRILANGITYEVVNNDAGRTEALSLSNFCRRIT